MSLTLAGFNWTAQKNHPGPINAVSGSKKRLSLISITIQKERQGITVAKQRNYTKPSPKLAICRLIFLIIVHSAEIKVLFT